MRKSKPEGVVTKRQARVQGTLVCPWLATVTVVALSKREVTLKVQTAGRLPKEVALDVGSELNIDSIIDID